MSVARNLRSCHPCLLPAAYAAATRVCCLQPAQLLPACPVRQTSARARKEGVQHLLPAKGLAPALLVVAAPVPRPEAVAAKGGFAGCG